VVAYQAQRILLEREARTMEALGMSAVDQQPQAERTLI
jgi:hypothetical protein